MCELLLNHVIGLLRNTCVITCGIGPLKKIKRVSYRQPYSTLLFPFPVSRFNRSQRQECASWESGVNPSLKEKLIPIFYWWGFFGAQSCRPCLKHTACNAAFHGLSILFLSTSLVSTRYCSFSFDLYTGLADPKGYF